MQIEDCPCSCCGLPWSCFVGPIWWSKPPSTDRFQVLEVGVVASVATGVPVRLAGGSDLTVAYLFASLLFMGQSLRVI